MRLWAISAVTLFAVALAGSPTGTKVEKPKPKSPPPNPAAETLIDQREILLLQVEDSVGTLRRAYRDQRPEEFVTAAGQAEALCCEIQLTYLKQAKVDSGRREALLLAAATIETERDMYSRAAKAMGCEAHWLPDPQHPLYTFRVQECFLNAIADPALISRLK